MANDNDKIKHRYNRISKVYDMMEKPMEWMAMNKWQGELIKRIEGSEILEVGVGTGKNLRYYPDNASVVGIDFSTEMLKKAKIKAGENPKITLLEMDAQQMAFQDDMFDTVVTSCVFCSVPDPIKGLQEIRRVCKPEGKIVMLEHMRSNHRVVGKLMDTINFIPLHFWGANINRKTLENLKAAGFKAENIEYEDVWTDIVKLIEIRNKK